MVALNTHYLTNNIASTGENIENSTISQNETLKLTTKYSLPHSSISKSDGNLIWLIKEYSLKLKITFILKKGYEKNSDCFFPFIYKVFIDGFKF